LIILKNGKQMKIIFDITVIFLTAKPIFEAENIFKEKIYFWGEKFFAPTKNLRQYLDNTAIKIKLRNI